MKKYSKNELFKAFEHYADCESIRIDHEENEYLEKTMSNVVFVTLVEKLFYENEMGVIPKNELFTDQEIEEVVDKIAYSQLAEQQIDDFIEKICILRNFIDSKI